MVIINPSASTTQQVFFITPIILLKCLEMKGNFFSGLCTSTIPIRVINFIGVPWKVDKTNW